MQPTTLLSNPSSLIVLAIPHANDASTSTWQTSSNRLREPIETAKQSIFEQFGETDLIAILIPPTPSPIPVALRAVDKVHHEDAWSNAVRMLRDMLAQRQQLFLYPFSEHDGSVLAILRYIFSTAKAGARHVVYLDQAMPEVKELESQAARLGVEIRCVAFAR